MKYFEDFNIHKKLLGQFQNAFENDKLAHAFLFYGPEGTGKEAIAFELAKLLNCNDNEKTGLIGDILKLKWTRHCL